MAQQQAINTAETIPDASGRKLGAKGLEQIIQIKLTAEEDAALKKSADAVKELCKVIGV